MSTVDSFSSVAVVSCSTKRSSISGGQGYSPTPELTGLYCTPLDPVDAELSTRAGLQSPLNIWQTFIEGDNDIVKGDVLTVASVDYDIRAVWDYSAWDGLPQDETVWKWLILEKEVSRD